MRSPGYVTDGAHFEGREEDAIRVTADHRRFDNLFGGDNDVLAGETGLFGEPKTAPQVRCAFGIAALYVYDGDIGNNGRNGEELLARDGTLEGVQVGIGLQ
jgi:hypothetical protein